MASKRTFGNQHSLPPLPVPDIHQTLHKYLQSVRPLVDDVQYANTERVVQTFKDDVLHNGLVQALQHKGTTHRNWLSDWWERETYLRPRYPIYPNINFGGPSEFPIGGMSQMHRAALMLHYIAQYWLMLRQERLPPMVSRGTNWCMNQTRRLFNTCRLPGLSCDTIEQAFCTGQPYCVSDLEQSLVHIMYDSRSSKRGEAAWLGALTCDNRTNWAKNRAHLMSVCSENELILKELQSSMIMFVLADYSCTEMDQLCLDTVAGSAYYKWADKSVCVTVHPDGQCSTNCDHGLFDAVVELMMMGWVEQQLTRHMNYEKDKPALSSVKVPLKSFNFVLDDYLRKEINRVQAATTQACADIDLKLYVHSEYANAAFKTAHIYGDTFIQLAIQLAYFTLYSTVCPVYETASTRKFYHGRTETVRSCTIESVAFVKCMRDRFASPIHKREAFELAYKKHNQLMHEAQEGKGIDRHLFGLRVLAAEMDLPDPVLFSDAAWRKSGGDGQFVLSTSFLGYSSIFGGCVAMCSHGYGCFYKIQPEKITMWLTCYKSDPSTDLRRFEEALQQSLSGMQMLLSVEGAKL